MFDMEMLDGCKDEQKESDVCLPTESAILSASLLALRLKSNGHQV